ncbi:MAG: hypothetical protein P8129_00720 [Anaerolineae bacterium]|jgi:hypothetical protein
MGIKTSVGQVALLGNGRNDRSSGILVEERTSRLGRGRSLGNLYIVTEVSGPEAGRDAVARQLAETMREAYYGRRGSITAGLQQALREANTFLFDENRNSLPTERRTAGASCVVLRDGDLFVAQAGPALVYLLHRGQFSRLPESSPWLDGFAPEEMDVAPLGERHDVNIALFHTPADEGDTVLLATCDLAQQIPRDDWPQLLDIQPVESILEEVLAAAGPAAAASAGLDLHSNLSALVVRLGEEPAGLAPAPVSRDLNEAPAPEASGTPVADDFRDQISDWAADIRPGERLRAAGLAIAGLLAALWAGLKDLGQRMIPEKGDANQATPRQEAGEPMAAPSPPRRPTGRRRVNTGDPIQKVLIGVAIAIPVIVGIVVLVVLLQRGQAQRAELDALWDQANTSWQQAQTVSDRATIRGHLVAADEALSQLLERRPEYAEARELRDKVRARLDVINQIRRVSWIGELNSYEEDANLSRVVVQGTHVFVMDRHNGRVYHHQLDEELQRTLKSETKDRVLVSKGDQVDGVLVGDLVDMTWMPVGPNRQRASLVILESGGTLLDYDPTTGELLPLRVAATDRWQFPELVGSHSGRFYVLDTSANQIWRYDPTADGYASEPYEWLQEEVDLAGVVDMAIGDSIYLLYADGQIRRLTVGQIDTFDTADWDTPPRSPTALFTRPPEETQWLYVGDRGNSRIVQSGKEGTFQQQFRLADTQATENGDPLAQLTNLFVDEIGGHAFVLSGNKLYLLILPMSN